MPMNSTARMPAMTMIVVAAFLASGGLNAGTPVAMASVPVRATAPDANARSRSTTPTAWAVTVVLSTISGGGGWPPWPRIRIRYAPMPIIVRAPNRNRYVGTAKMLPASRTPRRFATVIRPMASTPISTRIGSRPGTAETSCSTADDVETAAVRL